MSAATRPPTAESPYPSSCGSVADPALGEAACGRGRTSRLKLRFEDHLRHRPEVLPPSSHVLIALSGGPDSMALLALLTGMRDRFDLQLHAAHFDHGVREGSDREARVVVGWSDGLGVACRIGTAAPAPRASQENLRDCRYRFLLAEAARTGASRIATAHHADDQAETVLFRLLRGTGLRGLGGIPSRRGMIVRPLLPFRRAEILEYLREARIPFLEDPSNADPRWARARLRHQEMPAISRRWRSEVAPRLVSLGDAAARADAALDRVAWRVLLHASVDPLEPEPAARRFARELLAGRDDELLARALRQLTERLGVQLSAGGTSAGVEFIKQGRSGTAIDLGGGLELRREFEMLMVGSSEPRRDDRFIAIKTRDAGSGMLFIGGRRYFASWAPKSDLGLGGDSVALPEALLRYPIDLRSWRPGDRMHRAAGSRKLKRLFNDLRVPSSERRKVPLVATGSSVLWAFGLATAHGVRRLGPGERPMSALSLKIEASDFVSPSRTGTCSDTPQ